MPGASHQERRIVCE